jgi:hypothetical protein
MKRGVLALAATLALTLTACGGNASATQAPGSASSQVPQSSRGQATHAGQGGEPIDTAAIQAAVAALKTHDSWMFEATTYQSGTPDYSQTLTGTQRTSPQKAVSATHNGPNTTGFHYVRIGDDIWYDLGQPTYTHTTAADATNLTVQYEPYYLDGLVQSATDQDFDFEPVATETISGIATTHYRLSQDDLEKIVENLDDMTTADWAGDAWISDADGSLIQLAWGPQSLDDAQLTTGFKYLVTSIDCACPVDPPTAAPS